MDNVILILLLLLLVFIIYTLKSKGSSGSSELLIQLTNNLSNEIQNIRKEVSENSEKNRLELESKLSSINKEINNFHIPLLLHIQDFHKQIIQILYPLSEKINQHIFLHQQEYQLLFSF